MNLRKIQDLTIVSEKKLEKYDYIDKMHSFNKTLFYLSERLRNTDIEKIELQDGSYNLIPEKIT